MNKIPALIAAGLAAAIAAGFTPAAVQAAPAPTAVALAQPAPIDRSRQMPAADRTAIDTAAAQYLAQSVDKTPGLWLAVWDPEKGYYEQGYGQAVIGGAPATTKDAFRIGSITKTVFATAVLERVAGGQLALTDTVKDLDPALARKYPAIAKATVKQLLGMTSRIPDYADAAVGIMVSDPQRAFTRGDLISLGLAKGKAIPAPGGYSTTNYIILGEVMKKVTGLTPEQLVNSVFRQSGMKQSRLPAGTNVLPNPKATGYSGALLAAEFGPLSPSLTATTDVGAWRMDWGKEGGGAYSTIGDLAKWGGLCLGTSLLPPKVSAQRLKTTKIDAGNYGLGIIRQGDWLSHSGQAVGYEANVACNPKTGAVVALAVNSTYGMIDVNGAIGDAAYPAYAKADGG
ncbi:MAG: serine hydrolase domain-containing protein [Candidatus Nanopelagicales bacterium]